MTLLDIIVGHFLPSLFGWTFLVFVLSTESFFLSTYLTKKWVNNKIFISAIASNVITTIIGYFLLDEENIGGHLLNWIPVDHYHGNIIIVRTIFLFISAFVGSLIIETLFNVLLLKRHFTIKKIFLGTFLANSLTYIVGGITILLYNVCNL